MDGGGRLTMLTADDASGFSTIDAASDETKSKPARKRRKAATPSKASLMRFEANDPERFADTQLLASWGLSVRCINQLTGYPDSMILNLHHICGLPLVGGRRKSSVADYVRNPIYHIGLSLFVVMVDRLKKLADETQLTARTFVTAVRASRCIVNEQVLDIPGDLLFRVAESYINGTSELVSCRRCNSCTYISVGMDSGLLRKNEFDCPNCRLIGAMAGGVGAKTEGVSKRIPKKLSQLNLDRSLQRFSTASPPTPLVRAVLEMVTATRR